MECQKKQVSLHNLGGTSEKNTSILFSRFALTLHNLGGTSEKNTSILFSRFALSLHNIGDASEKNAVLYSFHIELQKTI